MSQRKLIAAIPNSITSLNALAGCISIVSAFEGRLEMAGLFIFIAAVFDFFDGFAARMLKAYSAMGKELDSLADAISFGLAPAVLAYHLLQAALHSTPLFADHPIYQSMLPYLAFVIAVFSILRLAKFNIDARQTDSFIGLPTPANAILWASFPFILAYKADHLMAKALASPLFLLLLVFFMSSLLLLELPLLALKFKNFNFKENQIRYIFLLAALILLVFFTYTAILPILLVYILLSLLKKH